MRLVGDARYCASSAGYVDFRTCDFPISPHCLRVLHFSSVVRTGVPTWRRTSKPRALAIARRSDDIQPTAILGAIGMIATLMLLGEPCAVVGPTGPRIA